MAFVENVVNQLMNNPTVVVVGMAAGFVLAKIQRVISRRNRMGGL
ncbi:MAG: hypothetical protein ABEK01_03685 [Candidatus Nanohaloarchaea archaeon]